MILLTHLDDQGGLFKPSGCTTQGQGVAVYNGTFTECPQPGIIHSGSFTNFSRLSVITGSRAGTHLATVMNIDNSTDTQTVQFTSFSGAQGFTVAPIFNINPGARYNLTLQVQSGGLSFDEVLGELLPPSETTPALSPNIASASEADTVCTGFSGRVLGGSIAGAALSMLLLCISAYWVLRKRARKRSLNLIPSDNEDGHVPRPSSSSSFVMREPFMPQPRVVHQSSSSYTPEVFSEDSSRVGPSIAAATRLSTAAEWEKVGDSTPSSPLQPARKGHRTPRPAAQGKSTIQLPPAYTRE